MAFGIAPALQLPSCPASTASSSVVFLCFYCELFGFVVLIIALHFAMRLKREKM